MAIWKDKHGLLDAKNGEISMFERQQPQGAPQLVNVDGRVINLAHITLMEVTIHNNRGDGTIHLVLFGCEEMYIYRRENGGRGTAAFDALLRFYHTVPAIEKVM